MQHLLTMHNFASIFAIVSGINISAVFRLKHTRESLPESAKEVRLPARPINRLRFLLFGGGLSVSADPATGLESVGCGDKDRVFIRRLPSQLALDLASLRSVPVCLPVKLQ
jgi:hypothetical protein